MTTDRAATTDLSNRQLPEQFAERFGTVLGRERPPETLADWADAIAAFFADQGVSIGVEDLCHAEASRHRATVAGEERHFQCVLDPLLVPFLDGAADHVAVTSRSPIEGVPVAFEVRRTDDADGAVSADAAPTRVDADPDGAVVSLGVAADGRPATELDRPLEAYGLFCPYVNAFPDREAYEAWASETPSEHSSDEPRLAALDETEEAIATAVSAEEAVAVARRLAEAPAGLRSGSS